MEKERNSISPYEELFNEARERKAHEKQLIGEYVDTQLCIAQDVYDKLVSEERKYTVAALNSVPKYKVVYDRYKDFTLDIFREVFVKIVLYRLEFASYYSFVAMCEYVTHMVYTRKKAGWIVKLLERRFLAETDFDPVVLMMTDEFIWSEAALPIYQHYVQEFNSNSGKWHDGLLHNPLIDAVYKNGYWVFTDNGKTALSPEMRKVFSFIKGKGNRRQLSTAASKCDADK